MNLKKKLGKSMCLREILEYLKPEKLIELQLVNCRRFYKFAQALITHLTIFRCRGIHMMNEIRVLTKFLDMYLWEPLDCTDKESGRLVEGFS